MIFRINNLPGKQTEPSEITFDWRKNQIETCHQKKILRIKEYVEEKGHLKDLNEISD